MISLEAFVVMGLTLMFLTVPVTLFRLIDIFVAIGSIKDDAKYFREKEEKLLSEYKTLFILIDFYMALGFLKDDVQEPKEEE